MAQFCKCNNGTTITRGVSPPADCSSNRTTGCEGCCDGGGIGGPTSNYSVTTGNAVAGNTSTRTFVTPIDPYQNITPSMLNANGGGQSRDLWFNQNGGQRGSQTRDLWFNQSGDAVIEVDGNKYAYEPVLTWDRGCDNLDNSGDGVFPNSNCRNRSRFGGVDGLRLGAYRFKNGVMDN
eukprot:COSAG01_NODE_9851_length_2320_cov_1.628095_5_plen_178_part_00